MESGATPTLTLQQCFQQASTHCYAVSPLLNFLKFTPGIPVLFTAYQGQSVYWQFITLGRISDACLSLFSLSV